MLVFGIKYYVHKTFWKKLISPFDGTNFLNGDLLKWEKRKPPEKAPIKLLR